MDLVFYLLIEQTYHPKGLGKNGYLRLVVGTYYNSVIRRILRTDNLKKQV
jgi:hypothetical protein